MPQLAIPDKTYDEAVDSLYYEFGQFDLNFSRADVKQLLKCYVELGQLGKIEDWSYRLADQRKGVILDKLLTWITYRTSKSFSRVKVETRLNQLDTLAGLGRISRVIAYPRTAQQEYDLANQKGHDNDTNPITKGIGDFFDTVGSAFGLNAKTIGTVAVGLAVVWIIANAKS